MLQQNRRQQAKDSHQAFRPYEPTPIITDDCIPASLIFQDEAAYCLQDTFKLTKAIMKCQLDIFEQIGSILAELQEQARQEAEEDGTEGEGI